MFLLVFEARESLQFFQTAVVEAETPSLAEQRLRDYLAKRDCTLIEIDSEETRSVVDGDVPHAWRARGARAEAIVGMSGWIWVDPEMK